MAIDARALAALPFFSRLDMHQRRALAQVLNERQYAPGESIFVEGEPGRHCAFIVSGAARVQVQLAAGSNIKKDINTMGPGEVFGEVALIDGGPRSATCLAGREGAVVALLSRADFGLLFDAGNPFAFAMVRLVCEQLSDRLRSAVVRFRHSLGSEGTGRH